jgi:hypothetical protein
MATKTTKTGTAAKTVCEPTSRERTAIDRFLARREKNLSLRIQVSKNGGGLKVETNHTHELVGEVHLMDALGTADGEFRNGILQQLANASSNGGEIDERGLNFMFSVIKGIEPRDQVETMLAAQMAAVHMASMRLARHLANVVNIPVLDCAERAFNKLNRTFATQMEALKRYRTGGEQKVTLQNVSVAEGGRAIVGNVTQAPRENVPEKTAAATPPAFTATNVVPMPITDEGKERALVAGRRKSTR